MEENLTMVGSLLVQTQKSIVLENRFNICCIQKDGMWRKKNGPFWMRKRVFSEMIWLLRLCLTLCSQYYMVEGHQH